MPPPAQAVRRGNTEASTGRPTAMSLAVTASLYLRHLLTAHEGTT